MTWKMLEANGAPDELEGLLTEGLAAWVNEAAASSSPVIEEMKESAQAAIKAAIGLVKAGAVGGGKVSVQLMGHTNPGHVAPEGWSHDVVQVLVRSLQEAVEAPKEVEAPATEVPADAKAGDAIKVAEPAKIEAPASPDPNDAAVLAEAQKAEADATAAEAEAKSAVAAAEARLSDTPASVAAASLEKPAEPATELAAGITTTTTTEAPAQTEAKPAE